MLCFEQSSNDKNNNKTPVIQVTGVAHKSVPINM